MLSVVIFVDSVPSTPQSNEGCHDTGQRSANGNSMFFVVILVDSYAVNPCEQRQRLRQGASIHARRAGAAGLVVVYARGHAPIRAATKITTKSIDLRSQGQAPLAWWSTLEGTALSCIDKAYPFCYLR